MKTTILNHNEFNVFQGRVTTNFNAWWDVHEPMLLDIEVGASPKEIIHAMSEHLLQCFAEMPLLDPYDVYQRLLDYWDETMQDDIYLIASDSWVKAAQPRDAIEDKNRKIKEAPDLTLKRKKYKMDLIPPALIVARYFATEQDAIEMLEAKQAAAVSALEEFVEVHTGEEGALIGLEEKQGISNKNVMERVMEHREAILNIYPAGTSQYIRVKSIRKTTFGNKEWTQDTGNKDSLFKELDIPHNHDENGLFEELGVLHEYLQLLKAKKQATGCTQAST